MSRSRKGGSPLPIPAKAKRGFRRERRAAATDALRNGREPERDRRHDAWRYW